MFAGNVTGGISFTVERGAIEHWLTTVRFILSGNLSTVSMIFNMQILQSINLSEKSLTHKIMSCLSKKKGGRIVPKYIGFTTWSRDRDVPVQDWSDVQEIQPITTPEVFSDKTR